ncbi:MAG: hypothetical protein IT471_01450 [Pseudomonadales bacterium]|jgi:ElaB/YqjD/DUF883 family membrane-anchored ribosome-binding protein|nr:hypothetical protein [Pseudomonadales bacterium]MCP5332715.1 hypothetical protein [Pseudomonadales bacterium]HMW83079.1 hypothetical protein [Pseudomonadales bacterium]HNC76784.1 hypothetical protein [Pseudomonadales bacterium]HNF08320.1 hypothetical protein [Pseudomonadales bacterium]
MREPNSLSDAITQLQAQGGSTITDEAKALLRRDIERLRQTVAELKPQLAELKAELGIDAQTLQQQVEQSTAERPWTALGLAGLAGLMLGLLLRSGRK